MKNKELFIEMKQKDIAELREKLWLKNDKKCPVLGKEVSLVDMALDHIHGTKTSEYSPESGVIRESLHKFSNAVLGKLENSIKRTGLNKDPDFDLPTFLRNAADYFERGAYQDSDGNYYVHPNEVKKDPPVSKSNYNRLAKLYKESGKKAKFPEYPKSKKLTKKLQELFSEFNIEPFN